MQLKVASLFDKQAQLMKKLRESSKKEVAFHAEQIRGAILKEKDRLLVAFLPNRLQNEALLDCYENVQFIAMFRQKALLLLRELLEKQIPNATTEDNFEMLFQLFIGMGQVCSEVVNASSRTLFCLSHMSNEKYAEAMKSQVAWKHCQDGAQYIDKVLQMLREETISSTEDYSSLANCLKEL